MKTKRFIACLTSGGVLFSLSTGLCAQTPVWTFTPLTATTITVPINGTATVQYTVTNQSNTSHTLTPQSLPAGVTQVITGSGVCPNPFTLAYLQSCTLTLSIDGSALQGNVVGGPVVCQTNPDSTPNSNQCYQPSEANSLNITRSTAPGMTMLEITPNELALSVKNPSLNAQLTGTDRTITIQNTGSFPAAGLNISYPTWPGGTPMTTATSTCGSTLAAGLSCTITVHPGSEPTDNCNTGSEPTPGTITVSANNVVTPVMSNVLVLSYGCIAQGGFIYSIDDLPPSPASIGGKTAATADTVTGQPSPAPGTPNWGGFGTDIGSSLYESNPQGANNGSANSAAIVSTLTPPTSLSDYAAGLCSTLSVNASGTSSCAFPQTCYTNWYLPAICELGPLGAICTLGSTNIQQQLFEVIPAISSLGLVNNAYYWSSTEDSGNPTVNAWDEFFSSGGSNQGSVDKHYVLGVRCSRALTL